MLLGKDKLVVPTHPDGVTVKAVSAFYVCDPGRYPEYAA